jgi:hypothetical protein
MGVAVGLEVGEGGESTLIMGFVGCEGELRVGGEEWFIHVYTPICLRHPVFLMPVEQARFSVLGDGLAAR